MSLSYTEREAQVAPDAVGSAPGDVAPRDVAPREDRGLRSHSVAIGDRIGHTWRAVALVGVGLAGGAAAVAVATVPDSSGVIHACVTVSDSGGGAPITNGPNVTVIDPSAGQACTGFQQAISWNVSGPQGQPGQTGAQGPPGAPGNTSITYTVVPPTARTNAPGIGTATLGPLTFSILSLNWAIGKPSVVRRQVPLSGLTVSKALDATSPRLHEAVSSGTHFRSATISLYRRPGSHQIGLIIKLSDVVISALQISQSGLSPLETVSLSFGKITKIYK